MSRKDNVRDDEKLHDYVAGRLSARDARELEGELASSADLRKTLSGIQGYYKALEQLGEVRAPDKFLDAVHAKIGKKRGMGAFFNAIFLPLHSKLPVELAGIAVAALLLFMIYNPPTMLRKSVGPAALSDHMESPESGAAPRVPELEGPSQKQMPQESRERSLGAEPSPSRAEKEAPSASGRSARSATNRRNQLSSVSGHVASRTALKPSAALPPKTSPEAQGPAAAAAEPFEAAPRKETASTGPVSELRQTRQSSAEPAVTTRHSGQSGISYEEYRALDVELEQPEEKEPEAQPALPTIQLAMQISPVASIQRDRAVLKLRKAPSAALSAASESAAPQIPASPTYDSRESALDRIKAAVRDHNGVMALNRQDGAGVEYTLTVAKDQLESFRETLESLGIATAPAELTTLYSNCKLRLVVTFR
jgi:hypothetical protein